MNQSILWFICGWYVCSVTLSLYNKWMFDPQRGLSVPFPILITSMHQWLLWGISWAYRKAYHIQRPVNQSQRQRWRFYLKFIIPTALASAGDIGLGNVSFKFVPLTIYTIVKSSSIAFVLLFGCIFGTERFHWRLACIVAVMFLGVVMMIYKPESGEKKAQNEHIVLGILLVLGSSMLSGLRWVYTQLILQKTDSATSLQDPDSEKDTKSPVDTIYQLAPVMGLTLCVTAMFVEKPFPAVFKSNLFQIEDAFSALSIMRGILLLTIPGVLVFMMTICEFGILQRAHVLTLSVAGVVKELITILASMLILRETLTGLQNWLGMLIILLDVCYYNIYRYKQRQTTQLYASDESAEVLIQEYELESNKHLPLDKTT